MKLWLCPRCDAYVNCEEGDAIPVDDYAEIVHRDCATDDEIEAYEGGQAT